MTAGVIYAVLLGFTVIAEWEFYDSAKSNTAEEAALLVPLYRKTKVMIDDKGGEMRHLIRSYAEHVVEGWDGFRHGARNTQAGYDECLKHLTQKAEALGATALLGLQLVQSQFQWNQRACWRPRSRRPVNEIERGLKFASNSSADL